MVIARVPGTARIVAEAGGVADGVHLTVLPRPRPVSAGAGDADELRAESLVEPGWRLLRRAPIEGRGPSDGD